MICRIRSAFSNLSNFSIRLTTNWSLLKEITLRLGQNITVWTAALIKIICVLFGLFVYFVLLSFFFSFRFIYFYDIRTFLCLDLYYLINKAFCEKIIQYNLNMVRFLLKTKFLKNELYELFMMFFSMLSISGFIIIIFSFFWIKSN